jgi:hypothetical protein
MNVKAGKEKAADKDKLCAPPAADPINYDLYKFAIQQDLSTGSTKPNASAECGPGMVAISCGLNEWEGKDMKRVNGDYEGVWSLKPLGFTVDNGHVTRGVKPWQGCYVQRTGLHTQKEETTTGLSTFCVEEKLVLGDKKSVEEAVKFVVEVGNEKNTDFASSGFDASCPAGYAVTSCGVDTGNLAFGAFFEAIPFHRADGSSGCTCSNTCGISESTSTNVEYRSTTCYATCVAGAVVTRVQAKTLDFADAETKKNANGFVNRGLWYQGWYTEATDVCPPGEVALGCGFGMVVKTKDACDFTNRLNHNVKGHNIIDGHVMHGLEPRFEFSHKWHAGELKVPNTQCEFKSNMYGAMGDRQGYTICGTFKVPEA